MNTISMKLQADELIRLALQEDISSEDVTTNSVMKEAVEGEVDVYKRQSIYRIDIQVSVRTGNRTFFLFQEIHG